MVGGRTILAEFEYDHAMQSLAVYSRGYVLVVRVVIVSCPPDMLLLLMVLLLLLLMMKSSRFDVVAVYDDDAGAVWTGWTAHRQPRRLAVVVVHPIREKTRPEVPRSIHHHPPPPSPSLALWDMAFYAKYNICNP
jgi:hypothetical protein